MWQRHLDAACRFIDRHAMPYLISALAEWDQAVWDAGQRRKPPPPPPTHPCREEGDTPWTVEARRAALARLWREIHGH